MPVRSAADQVPPKSKSRAAWDRVVRFVMQPSEQRHARRFQALPVANHFLSLPSNASARRGTARTVRSAVPHGQPAGRPRVTWRERLPAPCVTRQASGNKNDKVAEDFVFDPARQIVPEKTSRTLRVSCDAGNPAACIRFADKILSITSLAAFSTA